MDTAGQFLEAYAELPEAEQAKVQTTVRALPELPKSYVGPVWLIVVLSFAIVFVGGGFLIYSLVQDSKATEVLVPIVTAALGVLAGLLAPSPVSK